MPGSLWVHYQKTFASVPEEKGDGYGNQAEVGGDTRHTGGAALDQCGPRAHRPWRAWIQKPWVQRPASLHQAEHRRAIWGILGTTLGALSLPTRRDRAIPTGLRPTLTAGRSPASSPAPILVLLRRVPSLLPLCPTVCRRMEAGDPHTTIESTCTSPRDRGGGESGVGFPCRAASTVNDQRGALLWTSPRGQSSKGYKAGSTTTRNLASLLRPTGKNQWRKAHRTSET